MEPKECWPPDRFWRTLIKEQLVVFTRPDGMLFVFGLQDTNTFLWGWLFLWPIFHTVNPVYFLLSARENKFQKLYTARWQPRRPISLALWMIRHFMLRKSRVYEIRFGRLVLYSLTGNPSSSSERRCCQYYHASPRNTNPWLTNTQRYRLQLSRSTDCGASWLVSLWDRSTGWRSFFLSQRLGFHVIWEITFCKSHVKDGDLSQTNTKISCPFVAKRKTDERHGWVGFLLILAKKSVVSVHLTYFVWPVSCWAVPAHEGCSYVDYM